MAKPGGQPNQPETYLTAQERHTLNRLLGFPEEFPHKFIAWLDDHLRVNVPQFPVTHVKGFQDFLTELQDFFIGEGATWPMIDAKGDLIVGFAPATVTILSSSAQAAGNLLVVDTSQPSGLKWVTPTVAISAVTSMPGMTLSARELQIRFGADTEAVTATSVSVGISALLAPLDLTSVAAYLVTDGSTDTVIDIPGVLDDPITIQSGETWDDGTATIDDGAVSEEDILAVTVTSAGTDAEGLGVILTFS